MEKKLRGILDELVDYAPTPTRDRDLFIESRGQQVIASATNLLKLIKESYDAETADDISRRLIRAIASGDEDKFRRKIRTIRESKTELAKGKK